jgi:two-component sensor histidine kinase
LGPLSRIDLPRRLKPVLPLWAGELITSFICLAGAAVVRIVIDMIAPGVTPFVLIFPLVLLAALAGGWRTGALTLTVAELWAWYYVIPPRGFFFKGEAQPANLAAIWVAGLIVVAAVHVFRSLTTREVDETQARVAERDLMLRELEHRMKNNFQTVAALLEMQLRRASDEPARAALREALTRVISISQAHRNLYAGDGTRSVDMSVYLSNLCADLSDALFLGEVVRLDCQVEAGSLDRDRAVAVGLIVNELVTNAAKHAFTEGRPGQIKVVFGRRGDGYRLTVEDDGRGLPSDFATRRTGLGRGLVEAFSRQAGGKLIVRKDGPGAKFEVDLAA